MESNRKRGQGSSWTVAPTGGGGDDHKNVAWESRNPKALNASNCNKFQK
jgi:hypothetical protein